MNGGVDFPFNFMSILTNRNNHRDRIATSTQPERVRERGGVVPTVLIEVRPTANPDRILVNEPPRLLVVVPIAIVVEPRRTLLAIPLPYGTRGGDWDQRGTPWLHHVACGPLVRHHSHASLDAFLRGSVGAPCLTGGFDGVARRCSVDVGGRWLVRASQ